METMVPYTIYLVLALVGMGMAAIVVFGIRNLAQGKVNIMTVVLSGIPIVLLLVLGFVLGDWSAAAIYTVLIALVMTSASLLLSGLRGIIN
ncbi:MAG: hypothetical protein ACI9W4_001574 [Rhodothermales bacterium]|jgi:hypothetical protein